MSQDVRVSYRFTREDVAILAATQKVTGIRAKTEVLRVAIRQLARANGIDPERLTEANDAGNEENS